MGTIGNEGLVGLPVLHGAERTGESSPCPSQSPRRRCPRARRTRRFDEADHRGHELFEFGVAAEFFVQYKEQSKLIEDISTYNSFTSTLRVGDRVRINHRARPLYLHGHTGTVAGFYGQSVIVRLDQPVGRFVTGELRCPPLALDRPGPE